MRAADLDRRSLLARAWRLARSVTLVTLAAIALVVGSAWMFLQTRWGGELVRKLALPKVNDVLAGHLDLGRFDFGGNRLTLERIVLRDPEGAVVARVERLDLAFSPLSLLRHRLDLERVAVVRPELWLIEDQAGLNLSRALAARSPEPERPPLAGPPPSPTGRGMIVDLRRLELTEGTIDLRSNAGGRPRHAHLASLEVGGSARYDAGQSRVSTSLAIGARGGQLELHGDLDLRRLRAPDPGLVIRGRALDLSQLVDGAPSTALAFDLAARGGGRDLATVDASLDLAVPAGRVDGQTVGPIRLRASAEPGRYTLTELRAIWPGLEVTGGGTAATSLVDARARVEIGDLAALARSLAAWGIELPPLAGRGRLDVVLGGRLAAPSLRVAGKLPRLRVGANEVWDLTVAATVPDLTSPEVADLALAAPRAILSGRALRGLALSVQASGVRLTADVRTSGPFPLTLAARGHRGSSPTSLTLDAMNLHYPEASWALGRPARLEFGEGRIAIEGFVLRAGNETMAADLRQTAGGVRGRLVISRLDLARLPRVLVPPALGVAGIVDVDARLSGSAAEPQVEAKLSLAGGRVRGYRELSLALDARYAGARARGHLEAHGLGTAISARFDVPAVWPPPDRGTPLLVDVTLGQTDLGATLAAVAAASGRPLPLALRGRARLSARLDGTPRSPRLAIDLGAKSLSVAGRPVGDVSLVLHGDGERPLEARLEVSALGASTSARTAVTLKTPLSLQAALRGPPTAATLARLPFKLQGDLERLPLGLLAQLARYRPPVGGTLTSHFALSGTALDPRGSLTVDILGATTGTLPPTDARLELDLERHAVDARVRVLGNQHPLLAAVLHLGEGIPALRDPALLVSAPIQLRAVIGPLQLQRLGLPNSDRDPPRVLKGRLHMDVTIDGTLRAPRVVLHADADDIRLDKLLVGVAQVEASYADRQAKLDARLYSANQGQLHATTVTTADLGYPAIRRGLDVRHLPLDVRLEAQRFDLQGLSGLTQGLRSVGGLLSASATVRGTVADPRVGGRVEWSGGLIAITGLGEYKDIHLLVHGDDQKLVLDELTARSGAGNARITADAAHATGLGYRFSARADVSQFPIYQEGQPLAQVSIGTNVSGTAAPFDTQAAVEIHNARIELADAKRKDLQALATPTDIILVDSGEPLNRAQAKKLGDLVAARPKPKGVPLAVAARVTPVAAALASAVRLTVNAPRKVWVTGKDAYLEIGLSPGFRVSLTDRTQVVGQVIVKRGRIDILGRRFDLKADSTLEFSGAADRPELDITAQYQSYSENVTVVLTAKGQMDHLAVAVTSPNRPDLTESQLYTLIITGHLQLGGGTSGSSGTSAEAASFVGGALAAQLQKTLAKTLPLDVLTVDAGGGEGLTGTQLEAGRYMTEKLYVGYVGRVGADPSLYQNRNAVHVEYQLSPRWSVDGEYGDVGTGSLDLTWKKNY
jgi:translocation and assembly module TamB